MTARFETTHLLTDNLEMEFGYVGWKIKVGILL